MLWEDHADIFRIKGILAVEGKEEVYILQVIDKPTCTTHFYIHGRGFKNCLIANLPKMSSGVQDSSV